MSASFPRHLSACSVGCEQTDRGGGNGHVRTRRCGVPSSLCWRVPGCCCLATAPAHTQSAQRGPDGARVSGGRNGSWVSALGQWHWTLWLQRGSDVSSLGQALAWGVVCLPGPPRFFSPSSDLPTHPMPSAHCRNFVLPKVNLCSHKCYWTHDSLVLHETSQLSKNGWFEGMWNSLWKTQSQDEIGS